MYAIELEVNEKLYLRNPQRSKLGRKILQHSVVLIDEIGFERFTFRKLAERIGSAETSIYRYFENKHYLLIYLLNWYWEWMKFRVDFKTNNINDPRHRLKEAISCIVDTTKRNTSVEFIDEDVLHRLVVTESTKAYHSKEIDEQNREGFFLSYKVLSEKLAGIIDEVNPSFPYPRALASNLLEMANNHVYFAVHLPRLTEVREEDGDVTGQVVELLTFFAFQLLSDRKVEAKNSVQL
jgi:AcrR family transcriptional regulator